MSTDQPTPSDTLHQAAQLLRDRANAATPGPWTAAGLFAPAEGCRCLSCHEGEPWAWEIAELDGPDSGDCIHPMHIRQADAEHIAAWHPAVALAVAGWLWAVAIGEEYEPETAPRIQERIAALAVARSYLGGQVTA